MTCLKGLWAKPSTTGKPLKVEDHKEKRKVGFVAKSLKELAKKVSVKFQVLSFVL